MDFSQFLQELGVYGHLTALLLGTPRLFALVTVAPFLGSAVVMGQIRLLLVLALYLPLHPVIVSHLTDEITLSAALSLAVGVVIYGYTPTVVTQRLCRHRRSLNRLE